jgi:hypothetical protein
LIRRGEDHLLARISDEKIGHLWQDLPAFRELFAGRPCQSKAGIRKKAPTDFELGLDSGNIIRLVSIYFLMKDLLLNMYG